MEIEAIKVIIAANSRTFVSCSYAITRQRKIITTNLLVGFFPICIMISDILKWTGLKQKDSTPK